MMIGGTRTERMEIVVYIPDEIYASLTRGTEGGGQQSGEIDFYPLPWWEDSFTAKLIVCQAID